MNVKEHTVRREGEFVVTWSTIFFVAFIVHVQVSRYCSYLVPAG